MSNIATGIASVEEMSVEWSWDARQDGSILLELGFTNTLGVDVYLFDRLWTLGPRQVHVVDSESCYRSVRDGSLRLLLGAAPLPLFRQVLYRNVPHVTCLAAGRSYHRAITLRDPTDEYNVYFPVVDRGARELRTTHRLDLVVRYVVARGPIRARGIAPEAPDALELENSVAAAATAQSLHVAIPDVPLSVWRRTDEFERVALPGEARGPL